jgi:hypothetical protein
MKIVGLLETALINTRANVVLIVVGLENIFSLFHLLFYMDIICVPAVNNTSFVLNEIKKILQGYTRQVCFLIHDFAVKVVANGGIKLVCNNNNFKLEKTETESVIRM